MNRITEVAARHNSEYRLAPPSLVDGVLTPGGRIIYARTRRPAPTCNLMAALAGLGRMEG